MKQQGGLPGTPCCFISVGTDICLEKDLFTFGGGSSQTTRIRCAYVISISVSTRRQREIS